MYLYMLIYLIVNQNTITKSQHAQFMLNTSTPKSGKTNDGPFKSRWDGTYLIHIKMGHTSALWFWCGRGMRTEGMHAVTWVVFWYEVSKSMAHFYIAKFKKNSMLNWNKKKKSNNVDEKDTYTHAYS